MSTHFRVICKATNSITQTNSAFEVGVFMWGKQIDDHIIIKTDDALSRVINLAPAKGNINKIQQILVTG